METKNYHRTINVTVPATEVMKKINQVNLWWAKNFEGKSENLNDVFTVRFGTTFVTFKITEMEAGKKVAWLVTDCYLPWLKDKTEWNDTQVVFEIEEGSDGTKVNFTHIGLVPEVECYEACEKGWDGHVKGSLYNLIATGIGQPQ
jgi:hypothetical protein